MELLESLGFDFKLFLIQLFGFLLLFWLLKKFLWGRVITMIQRRGDEIKSIYQENEKTRNEVTALKSDYEKRLRDAKLEADSIIQDAKLKAEKAGQEIIDRTREEAAQIKEKGIKEIDLERHRVLSEIRNEVVDLSMEIALKIISKTIDKADRDRITRNLVDEIGGLSK